MKNDAYTVYTAVRNLGCEILLIFFLFNLTSAVSAEPSSVTLPRKSNVSSGACTPYITGSTIDIGNIVIPADTPVGAGLGTVSTGPYQSLYGCNNLTETLYLNLASDGSQSGVIYNSGQVFNTNSPGIGYIIGSTAACNDYGHGQCTGGESGNIWIPSGASKVMLLGEGTVTNFQVDWGGRPSIQLVKTGDITSGTLSGNIGHYSMSGSDGGISPSVNIALAGSVTVTGQSCTVLTSTAKPDLGSHLISEFTGINSTTTSVDVPVKLNCPVNILVNATLNATSDASTTQPGAIKLTPGSGHTAGGVAVQMVDSNGNGIPVGGVIQFHPLTAEIVDFGWKARYLQTTSTPVTAGDANASATITITYQ